jgi:Fe-S-cluster containining protein
MTEMPLSEIDIQRILKKIPTMMSSENFVFKDKEGIMRLKNKNDHCVFFNPKAGLCTIYKVRPQGCRFYPLVYDSEIKSCILDEDCPRPRVFFSRLKKIKKTCKKIIGFITIDLKIPI